MARRERPDGTADFFAGNLLPDLLAVSGDGRLRGVGDNTRGVADGVRLHIATDKWFHGLPVFSALQAEANALLLAAPWKETPRRRFFVAHVLVELALDAHLLHETPTLPDDLYAALAESLSGNLVATAETLLGRPAPNLEASTTRFVETGFLRDYATPAGCAESLTRVCRRAGVPNFTEPADTETLAHVFADFAPMITQNVAELLPN